MRALRLASLLLLLSPAPSARLAAAAVIAPHVPAGPGLRFDLGPVRMRASFNDALNRAQSALAEIAKLPVRSAGFQNTVRALEDALADFNERTGPLTFVADVSADPEVRALALELKQEAARFKIGLRAREDLYRRVRAAARRAEDLDSADRRLLEDTLRGFRESGAGLSVEQRAKLKALSEKLASLESRYMQNLAEHEDALEVAAADLQDLPEDYVASLPRTKDGRYLVGLDYPVYFPFMELARDASLRRSLKVKFDNRAAGKNKVLLREILRLRRDSAKILGEKTYAHLALKRWLAGTPEIVRRFLGAVKKAVASRARAAHDALLELKRADEPGASRVEPWDALYYLNKLKRERLGFDPEEVRKRFPVEKVIAGTLGLYQRLLGVSFAEVADPAPWHKDARLFAISDRSGRVVGYFYLDLFPREGKYGHFQALSLVEGRLLPDGSYRAPVAAMVANFPAPAAGAQALLTHEDVETFLHEFGHLLHATLTRARYSGLAGMSVAMDFVEAPSQMFEKFAWSREVLALVSGQPFPEELLEKMRAARAWEQSLSLPRLVALSLIDLAYHTAVPHDTTRTFRKIWESVVPFRLAPGTRPEASFEHTVDGYASAFYGYLWADRYSYAAFDRFLAEGLLNPAVGAEYLAAVLARGASRPEAESIRDFLGREATDEDLLKHLR